MFGRSKSSVRPQRARSLKGSSTLSLAAFFLLGGLAFFGFDLLFSEVVHCSLAHTPAAGPWGQLEYTTVKLERPDDSFPDVLPAPEPIRWMFENFSGKKLAAFIAKADLTADQKKQLLDRSRWQPLPNGWQISPPLELVRDMSLSARRAFYSILRLSPQNPHLRNPARIDYDKFDDWLADTELPKDKQELIRKLALRDGNSVYFYDELLLDWLCSTPAERKDLAQVLTQTPALLLKVRITPQTDVDALLRYWGQGGRGETVRSFMESLDDVPCGASVSVSWFFPAFARMRLYTYPDVRTDSRAYQEDCFWTALNFFNDTPDYTLLEKPKFLAKLKAEYREVTGDFTFGDIMALVNSRKMVEHMCVYIADDVVFTKNGATPLAPWVLMKRTEMLKAYPTDQPLRLRVYRTKTTAGMKRK